MTGHGAEAGNGAPAGGDLSVRVSTGDLLAAALALALLGIVVYRRWYVLAPVPSPPEPTSPPVGAALFIAAVLLGVVGTLAAAAIMGIDAGPEREAPLGLTEQGQLMGGMYLGQAVVIIIFVVLLLRAKRPRPDRRPGWAGATGIAVAALLVLWPILLLTGSLSGWLMRWVTGEPTDVIAHGTLRSMLDDPWTPGFLLVGFGAVVLAPIFEEVFYRGLLQRTVRQMGIGPWPAIIGTSLFFAFVHIGAADAHALVVLFVLSLGFGWVYERTGRLFAPLLMHMLFNAGNLAMAMTI